jgi:hypothetical protein
MIGGASRGKVVEAPGAVGLLHALLGLVAPVFRLRKYRMIDSMASRH